MTLVHYSSFFLNTLFLDRGPKGIFFHEVLFKSNQIIFFLFEYHEKRFPLRRALIETALRLERDSWSMVT